MDGLRRHDCRCAVYGRSSMKISDRILTRKAELVACENGPSCATIIHSECAPGLGCDAQGKEEGVCRRWCNEAVGCPGEMVCDGPYFFACPADFKQCYSPEELPVDG